MPFSRPTLQTLIDRVISDFESRLPGADARLRRSNLNVLSRIHASAAHSLYGFLDWISRQVFPDTAEAENLERWSTIWGIQRRVAAFAIGQATVTGTNGTVIPPATRFKRADGVEYETDAQVTIASGTATVAFTAIGAGQNGNASA
ncbi:MAG: baseplate J/gp47 family protein, partial [Burkholderiales bacterium]|nr:baseplate J/gp47 family protein [Burkholderiales bacterium]